RGKVVVVNYRGGEAEEFFARAFVWVKPSLKRADGIIVPSGFLAPIFGKRGFATRIVPNIVNLDRFSPGDAARANEPHILVARNLEPLYDNATALQAFAIIRQQHPGARMTIAGTGPDRSVLEALTWDLGLTNGVTFAGRVENSEMPALYQTAHIAINPSLADNMPISILEALASGVPVVSTDVGGVPFLVEDEKTALLVPPRDPKRMAEAILRLLHDQPLRERLVQAGLDHARRFAWESVRGKLFSAYAMALGESTWASTPEGR
ncbi:MAG: glycosyltransferase family 4 protein, partial [Gammaproteobacteria bacterium]|nr:glycosyltransferase family 4 protein [Gammaproteobacteria bacterium]